MSLIAYLHTATSMSTKTSKRNSAIQDSILSGSTVASGHFENRHDTVMRYLFPFAVNGRRPITVNAEIFVGD